MHTVGHTIDRRPPLPADSLCEVALRVFVRDPECRVLAVVDGEQPIGLVSREPFLARMEVAGAAKRPILEVMDADPLVANAHEMATPFLERALAERSAALLSGFVVTADGAYLGVGDLVNLMRSQAAGNNDPNLVERICTELSEPVARIHAAVEGLRRLRLPEAARAHLETIGEAGGSTLALFEVVKSYRMAMADRLELEFQPRRLQELMDDLDARWRPQAENAGVTLLVSYDGQPDCAAMIDHTRLLQVFDAFIGRAMAQVGCGVIEASLQARPTEAGVTLRGQVRDNGAEASAPARGVGIDLGMMLAERTVAVMSGAMQVLPNVGSGATVSFDLAADAADAVKTQEASQASEPRGRSAHVLVVDDNATNRMVVEALCEMFDCSTESVADGVEAVEAAKAGRFDVILMDIRMPRMDGVTATREIRKLPQPAGGVPIIALTANADPDEVAEYLAAGMGCVVEKPIKPDRLLEALDVALAQGASRAAA
jgi:CheY-like chemotaxis protein